MVCVNLANKYLKSKCHAKIYTQLADHKIVEQCTNILILAVNGYILGIEVNAWYIDMVDIQMIISFKKRYPSHIKQKQKQKINNIVMAYIKYDDTRTTPYSIYIYMKGNLVVSHVMFQNLYLFGCVLKYLS